MTYTEALDFLYSQLPMYQRIGSQAFKKDLGNIQALCALLNSPEKSFPSVHIAGTNGKGTVTHLIASALIEAGYQVGYYTSPHYLDYRERIRINGVMISEDAVVQFLTRYSANIEAIQPSFFELSVAMAFDYFRQEAVDIAIIETGLGGRLDSTNVLNPVMSIITNIGCDHQAMLGETLEEIAAEKAGIIKAGVPVLIGERQAEVEAIFTTKTVELGCAIHFASDETANLKNAQAFASLFDSSHVHNPSFFKQKACFTSSSIVLKNRSTAIKACQMLAIRGFRVEPKHIRDGILAVSQNTGYLGRMMLLSQTPWILADSAHNPAGIEPLINHVNQFKPDKIHVLYGTVSDRKLQDVLPLFPENVQFYFARPDIPRGMPVEKLVAYAEQNNLRYKPFGSVNQAFEAIGKSVSLSEIGLVCGSVFVVAEVLRLRSSGDSKN